MVRKYWDQLQTPPGSALLEAARFGYLVRRILRELHYDFWELLYRRLDGPRGRAEYLPIVWRLERLIDRRPALGIKSPEPSKDQEYRGRMHQRRAG